MRNTDLPPNPDPLDIPPQFRREPTGQWLTRSTTEIKTMAAKAKTTKTTKTVDKPASNGSGEDETVTPTLPALTGETALTSTLTPEDLDGLDAYLQAAAGEAVVNLKYKKNRFLAGPDNTELPLGTELAVNTPSISDGWLKWADKKPIASAMTPVIEGPPTPRQELGDTDEDLWPTDPATGEPRDVWTRTMSVVFRSPETLEEYRFSTSSVGGLNAIRRLLRAIRLGLARGETRIPVIALESDWYQHPEFDQVYYPRFPVVAWKSEGELMAGRPRKLIRCPTTQYPYEERRPCITTTT